MLAPQTRPWLSREPEGAVSPRHAAGMIGTLGGPSINEFSRRNSASTTGSGGTGRPAELAGESDEDKLASSPPRTRIPPIVRGAHE